MTRGWGGGMTDLGVKESVKKYNYTFKFYFIITYFMRIMLIYKKQTVFKKTVLKLQKWIICMYK